MKQTRLLMGMPITVEIAEVAATSEDIVAVFAYFAYVDEKFSTYKSDSEITRINEQRLSLAEASADMQTVFRLAEQTKQATHGYFDIFRDGCYDPSGLVKGWAIHHAAELLRARGHQNFYVDAGGDIQADGLNKQGRRWRVGIRNPFNPDEIVKVLAISQRGVATSGTYVRGEHIYNPHSTRRRLRKSEIVSLTVIGPNIYEADRFATAAFAMGYDGIVFIEQLVGFEGYLIDQRGRATLTSGFESYVYDAVD
jgi:thiamine biosynthesis lipoprotein